MKFLDNLVMKWAESIHRRQLDNNMVCEEMPKPARGRGKLTAISKGNSPHRVEHNYDDDSIITFKIYGANGGKIVETARYDDKRDNESIRRYVIDENADLAESLSKIVTLEYLR